MSGIAGVFNLDDTAVEPSLLQGMADAMRYRGRDGIDIRHDGPVGMVHCHFWTTPEDEGERQPLCSGRYWITADARVDNREELIPFLTEKGFLDKEAPTDAELILASYECWGEESPRHLVGDFAFALWDRAERRLFLARDVIGIRQLCYAYMDGRFYFGTTVGAVLAALPRSPGLNRRLIEDYLCGIYDPWVCQTVYSGILRLPPAHLLVVKEGRGPSRRLYYVLGSQRGPDCSSDQEWIEAFRELLDVSIRCRLRSTTPVGILVSGGLDSSSIACAAHEMALREPDLPEIRLYSAVYDETPEADEREYFEAVAARCSGFSSTTIPADRFWALREFGADNGYPLDEPEPYGLRSHTLALFRAPASEGCRVILFGEGGDQVFGQFLYFTPDALQCVGLRDWLTEAKYFREKCRLNWLDLLLRAYVKPVLPERLLRRLRALYHERVQPDPWIRRGTNGNSAPRPFGDVLFVHPGLSPSARRVHQMLQSPFNLVRYSTLDVTTAYAGVEWRLPFLDLRVVEFLLRIPHRLRCWRGIDRVILREGMRGTLPEEVRMRPDKRHLIELYHRGMRSEERQRIEGLLQTPLAEALGFIDSGPLSEAFESYWQGGAEDFQHLKRPLCLEAWLREGYIESNQITR